MLLFLRLFLLYLQFPVREGRCSAEILQIRSTPPPNPVYPEPRQHKRLQTTCSSGQPKPAAPQTASPSTGSYFLSASATRSDSARCLGTDHPVARKNWKEVAAEALLHGRPPLFEAARRLQDIVNRGPGGSAPTLQRKTHANCDRQPRQPREPAPGRLPAPRGAIPASRPRHHECADRRQDDPPASAGCAMTARSFWIWRARRARRRTASATCATGPPGAVQPRARAASPTPSPFTTSPMFTAAPTASSPASGARSAMIAPRWRGAGFRRSCEVLRGNVAGHGCAAEAGVGPAAKPTVVMDAGTEANIAWRARLDRGRRRPRVGPRLITDHEVQAPCQRGSAWSARAGRGPRTPFLAAGLRGGKAPPTRAGATTRCRRAVSGSASPPSPRPARYCNLMSGNLSEVCALRRFTGGLAPQ